MTGDNTGPSKTSNDLSFANSTVEENENDGDNTVSGDGLLDQDLDFEWFNIKERFNEQRTLDNLHASFFDVSAARNVGCVVASNKRRIRVLDMISAEDDDDEEENEEEE